MQALNRTNLKADYLPVRALQFGGGNFLRGFVGYLLEHYNKKTDSQIGIAVVKVTPHGDYQDWKAQDGLYHVRTKGLEQGVLLHKTELVRSVSKIIHAYQEWDDFLATAEAPALKFLFSNTTESGLQLDDEDQWSDTPPPSFPAKLCRWLYQRYRHFGGSPDAGCVVIPCELVEDNGQLLRLLVMRCAEDWGLELNFIRWLVEANLFCNSLVDRIVPGISKEKLPEAWQELGYEDHRMTEGEPYYLWVIEAPDAVRKALPLPAAGLNVIFTDDLQPYRERKVRILNGAHTALVPVAYLAGLRIVRDTVEDGVVGPYLEQLLREEVLPTLVMPEEELTTYLASIIDRFKNPYVDHQILSIALHSFTKFKVRLLPSLLAYTDQKGGLPLRITFALAALIRFYKGAYRGESIPLKDEPGVLEMLQEAWQFVDHSAVAKTILTWSAHWGQDLSKIPGLQAQVSYYLERMEKEEIREIIQSLEG